ncbi:MAG: type II toxin-antitoxin system RelB/DinJ family antitoxin [Deltaproteobacteria bacterium]|jgi:DNA-damage-inducible protein J|nr:type II toxin-antitoxin system RelB/DinJ family antitoxin [Deltaproteobacteria bacterium]
MAADASMLHVRVDAQIKAVAAANLAGVGLTISDAVRVLLARVANEGGLPPRLVSTPEQRDERFRVKVQKALDDPGPGPPLDEAMKRLRAKKRT